MNITKITDQHLLNRIKFFEKRLAERPDEQFYGGMSDYGDDWVEQENRHNEWLAEKIQAHIKYMKTVAKRRGITNQ